MTTVLMMTMMSTATANNGTPVRDDDVERKAWEEGQRD